jgi:hypothetical protein
MTDIHEAFGREPAANKATDHPLLDRSRWGLFRDVDVEAYHLGTLGKLRDDEVSISQSQMRRILEETPLDFAFHHPQILSTNSRSGRAGDTRSHRSTTIARRRLRTGETA